ncbi:MAG: zinc-binding dehydrogenase [Acidobacteria bacterium]|nr:MAG: zinc-binding dehydrogenase [Acidobacteriota bacterium]
MRAARFHGVGSPVRVEDVPRPEVGADEVLVEVKACGVCGSDIHFLEGMPVPGGLPLTLGHEPSGVVAELGSEVTQWSVGDRVALTLGDGCGECNACRSDHPSACPSLTAPGLHIDGAFADFCLVPATTLVKVPDNVSFAAAAVATDCVATPYHALRCRAQIQEGESVAVIGAGGLGTQAIALAKVLGAGTVVAADPSEVARERALGAGADAAVEGAGQIRQVLPDGAGLVLECVGLPETVSAGVLSLALGGRIVLVGVCMQPPPIPLPQAIFSLAEMTVYGAFASHKRDLEEVLALQSEGKIDIDGSISHRFPLEEAPAALEMLMSKEGDPQRIVVEIGQ